MKEITCKELIDFLDDYQDHKLDAPKRAEFERHLTECPECVDYLRTYRDTIELVRRVGGSDDGASPPPDAPEELIQAVLSARKRGTDE